VDRLIDHHCRDQQLSDVEKDINPPRKLPASKVAFGSVTVSPDREPARKAQGFCKPEKVDDQPRSITRFAGHGSTDRKAKTRPHLEFATTIRRNRLGIMYWFFWTWKRIDSDLHCPNRAARYLMQGVCVGRCQSYQSRISGTKMFR
jgi:hypothetical protein